MKKYSLFLLFILFSVNSFAYTDWDKTNPAPTSNAASIGTYVTNNESAIDVLVGNYRRGCVCVPSTTTSFNVLSGEIAIPTADGSIVKFRKNTTTTAVSASNIDIGGSFTVSTQYYVYALGDANASTFTVSVSTSSSAPSGATNYRQIGYFYSDASGNIVSVGNIKGGDVPNIMSVGGITDITQSTNSYVDMTDMVLYFVSSGRPVRLDFSAPILGNAQGTITICSLVVDGTSENTNIMASANANYRNPFIVQWEGVLSSGAHTIKVQWKSDSTSQQRGATDSPRALIAEEL